MAVVAELFTFLQENPGVLAVVVLIGAFILALSLMLSGPPASPNPFKFDTARPPAPLVTDQAERDKVLKNGFHVRKIPENLDAICIGSGAGSLTTANLLSKSGKRVLVLEQHDQAGGCCHTFIDKGFEFDVGIHYIGEMQGDTESRELIEQMTEGQLVWTPLDDDHDVVALGEPGKERRYQYLSGLSRWRDHMVKYFPDEVQAVDNYLKKLLDVRHSMMGVILLKFKSKWFCRLLIKTGIIHFITKYFSYSTKTLQEVLDELTDNEELKAVLAYSFGDYGTIPSESSFHMHGLLMNHFISGSSFPVGGASEIAFHMIPVIEKAGGKVLVRCPVSQILFNEEGRTIGVRVVKQSGNIDIMAPMVISGAGVINTFKYLIPKEIAAKCDIDKYIGGALKSGVGALSMFVGLRGTKEELGLHAQNLWAFSNHKIDEITKDFFSKSFDDAMSGDIPLMFISFPSAKDPSSPTRYPGKSTMTIVTLTPWEWFSEWKDKRVMKRGADYEALKKTIGDRILEQVFGYFPHLRDRVEYMEVGTPLTNNHYIAAPRGEIYGLDHNVGRFSSPELLMALRPEMEVPGLYLTGQDILSCGFTGAVIGGLITAGVILNRNVWADLQSLMRKKKQKQE